jgi:PqqD family protein of HPr-rel-A system
MPDDAVRTCALDDMVLLYHVRSGQTHMVISPVPEILEAMAGGAAVSADTLHDVLAAHYDLGDRAAAVAEIAAHLDALDALGLVRAA